MNAADVMVSNVIAVSPDATVQEVAEILLKNKISAVPVVSQSGKILGIVSEGDLLRRVKFAHLASPVLVAPASDGKYSTEGRVREVAFTQGY